MDALPDLDTIDTLLTVVEGRDPATTTAIRYDEDHAVLLDTQAEMAEMVSRELPPEYDKDQLRAILDRIETAIDTNRDRRAQAQAREGSDS